jgi:hypothetical protein
LEHFAMPADHPEADLFFSQVVTSAFLPCSVHNPSIQLQSMDIGQLSNGATKEGIRYDKFVVQDYAFHCFKIEIVLI